MVLNFDLFKCSLKVSEDETFTIEMGETEFTFKGDHLSQWKTAVANAINESKGTHDPRLLVEPWKIDSIGEKEFILKAKTCDLLLFRCSAGMVVRGFTGSEFDHVAMIIRID